jgi:hypothetical protein
MTRDPANTNAMYRDAVRDLTELRAEVERLRAAIREIMSHDCGSISYEIGKAALEPKPGPPRRKGGPFTT